MDQITFYPVSTREDIRTLAALAKEIWEQHFTPIIGADQVAYMVDKFQSEKALTAQLEEGYRYFMFQLNGEFVGFTGIHEQPEDKRLFLSKLYIRQSMRGKGISRRTLELIISICKENGLDMVWLTVNRYNTNTIEVYKHMGFVTVREQKADIGNGFYMDDYIMEYYVK